MHWMKRAAAVCGILFLLVMPPRTLSAVNLSPESAVQRDGAAPHIAARSAIIVSRATEQVLYEKNGYARMPMASTTKIMTALLIAEHCALSARVRVSRRAAVIPGSTMHLAEGEDISVETLLYGLLLCSGNDAAVALAEFMSGSVENFCAEMNARARMLGATDTRFTSPHGLDDEGHYTTACDLARISCAFLRQPVLVRICGTKQITAEGHTMTNTNPLLGVNSHVFGLKTGYTGNAGYCLVVAARNESTDFVIVLLNSPDSARRQADAQALTEYAVRQYRLYDILPRGHVATSVPLRRGAEKSVDAVTQQRLRLVLSESAYNSLSYTYSCTPYAEAPLAAGEPLGLLRVYAGDTCIAEVPLVAFRNVGKRSWLASFLDILTCFAYPFDPPI